jgi:hypothetical protein
VRDILLAKRREAEKNTHIDLDLPGFDGLLKVRYGALPPEEFAELVGRITAAQGQTGAAGAMAAAAANSDLLIRSCIGILTPVSADAGAPYDLRVDEQDGEPLLLNRRLANFLGFEVGSARDVVTGAFGNAPQPELAIADHVKKLMAWMEGAQGQINSDLTDSNPAPRRPRLRGG